MLHVNVRGFQLLAQLFLSIFFLLLREASEEQRPRQSLLPLRGATASHTYPCSGALVPALLWLFNAAVGVGRGSSSLQVTPKEQQVGALRFSSWRVEAPCGFQTSMIPWQKPQRQTEQEASQSGTCPMPVRAEPSYIIVSCPLVSIKVTHCFIPSCAGPCPADM